MAVDVHRVPTKNAELIGAAIGRGAQDPRTEYGPDKLLEIDPVAALRSRGVAADWGRILYPHYGRQLTEPIDIVAEFSRRLADHVAATLQRNRIPIVVGGDHSCAIGTWSGVHRHLQGGALGLIWIDAHMDSHTPETTESGAVHGMPLAVLLGHGEKALTSVGGDCAKLAPANVCLLGVRSYEAGESVLLQRLGVKVVFMEEIRRRGFPAALHEAIQQVTARTSAFGLSIDLDGIDPADAPGVGSAVSCGIPATELLDALRMLHGDARLFALEITEYNPFLDADGRTARVILEIIAAVLARAKA